MARTHSPLPPRGPQTPAEGTAATQNSLPPRALQQPRIHCRRSRSKGGIFPLASPETALRGCPGPVGLTEVGVWHGGGAYTSVNLHSLFYNTAYGGGCEWHQVEPAGHQERSQPPLPSGEYRLPPQGLSSPSSIPAATSPRSPVPAVCAAWRSVIPPVPLDVMDPGSLYIRID